MFSVLLVLVGFPVLLYIVQSLYALRKNISVAKQSGLPYVVAPWSVYNKLWLTTQAFLLPGLRRLPCSWTEPWLTLSLTQWSWTEGHAPFEQLGTKNFMIASPGLLSFCTCSADAVSQIVSRRNDFPKPLESYRILNIYGLNVVSTEGATWRLHRKITAPSFTEKNHELVWAESRQVAQTMLASWVGQKGHGTVLDIGENTMELTLHVISRAAFGVRLRWSTDAGRSTETSDGNVQPDKTDELLLEYSEDEAPPGHSLTYKGALQAVIANILWIMLMPHALLSRSPLQVHRTAWRAYREWHLYMTEIYEHKKEVMRSGRAQAGMDLMGALVRGAGLSHKPEKDNSNSAGSRSKAAGQAFGDDEILGNAFVFVLAGHETTANTLHFAIVLLAMNPSIQARFQRELDHIFGDKPISEWSYEEDFPKLFNGMAGAIMNETLRLIPPIISIVKCTQSQPQPLILDGRRVAIPARTRIYLNTIALHRDRMYWPTTRPAGADGVDDLDEFRPERWLIDDISKHPSDSYMSSSSALTSSESSTGGSRQQDQRDDEDDNDKDMRGPMGHDTASTLYRPPRGAYIPFSDGPRACLGRRFAQTEILVALAIIFRRHSVELAVHEHATDEEIAQMMTTAAAGAGRRRREEVWRKARDRAHWLLTEGMSSIVTLQMRKGKVPLSVVERGQERFWGF